MNDIYTDGEYLKNTKTWHIEDSPWKAQQILKVASKINIPLKSVAEIGCGAGRILQELSKDNLFGAARLTGFDVSPQAIKLCEDIQDLNITFACSDLLDIDNSDYFDLLLAMDVFEHVPDYMGFLTKCRQKAKFKIYHIPLDIHVSSVLRNSLTNARRSLGHLHYFTADTAIATLRDTGHSVIECIYTNSVIELFREHPSLKRAVANCPRWLLSRFSVSFAARMLGGYSLLVLAE